METEIPKNVTLTARKGRENIRFDPRTGLGFSCIGIPFRVNHDGSFMILLMKSNKGEWRFPGGTWENDETKEQCVVRECLEEGGIHAEVRFEMEPTLHFSRKLQRINKHYFWYVVEISEYFNRSAENRERKFFPLADVAEQLPTGEMRENWAKAAKFFETYDDTPSASSSPSYSD